MELFFIEDISHPDQTELALMPQPAKFIEIPQPQVLDTASFTIIKDADYPLPKSYYRTPEIKQIYISIQEEWRSVSDLFVSIFRKWIPIKGVFVIVNHGWRAVNSFPAEVVMEEFSEMIKETELLR